ncbi:unnamed protein product [Lathyrus sativus]|nr:unnamed protein product [Lathyrus sativus]
MAELWGLFEGIKLASMLGFKKVEVNVDSNLVVNAVERGGAYMRESLAIIRQIQRMTFFKEVRLVHSYKEANRCVNALVNTGCSFSPSFVVFDSMPDFLMSLLDADARDLLTARLMCVVRFFFGPKALSVTKKSLAFTFNWSLLKHLNPNHTHFSV